MPCNHTVMSKTPEIQIGWMAGSEFRGMPLTSRCLSQGAFTEVNTSGIRLFGKPVREIEKLHGTKSSWTSLVVKSGAVLPGSLQDELYHMMQHSILTRLLQRNSAEPQGFEIRYNVHTRIIKAFRPSDKATSEVKVLPTGAGCRWKFCSTALQWRFS